eukprot:m51a1_g3394 hypothetical protein (630) ;mRNA; r:520454-524550
MASASHPVATEETSLLGPSGLPAGLPSPEAADRIHINADPVPQQRMHAQQTYLLRAPRCLGGGPLGRPWMGVAGAMLVMLSLGAQFSWGTITMFVSDPGFLRGVPSTQTVWAYSLSGIVSPVMMFAAPALHHCLGVSATSALGCLLAGLGLIAAGQSTSVLMFNNVIDRVANPHRLPTRPPEGSTDEQVRQWEDEFHKEMVKRVPVMFLTYLLRAPRCLGGGPIGRPWMGVAGAMLVMLGLGAQHSWGTITMFVSDPGFLRGVPSTQTIWAYSLCGVVVPFMMFAAPALHSCIGVSETAALGSLVAGLGLIAAGQSTSLAHALVFNNVIERVANPRGLHTRPPEGSTDEQVRQWEAEFHKEMAKRVPFMFFVIGAITLVLGLLGSLFVHQPEERVVPLLEEANVEHPATTGGNPNPDTKAGGEDVEPAEMMKTPQFWMLYAVVVLAQTSCMLVLGSYSSFAKHDATFEAPFALVGGLAALANAFGRITWGAIADILDYRRVYVVVFSILSVAMFLYFETRTSVVLWSLCTCVIWLCYGGALSLLPTAVADAFGTRWHDTNYSWLFSGLAIGSLTQALMLTMLLERLGSYRKLFYIMGTLSTVACFLMVAYKPPGRGRWFAVWLSYKRTK